VSFRVSNDPHYIRFENPTEGFLRVTLAPDNPRLKQLGVRYVLLVDGQQGSVDAAKLKALYHSQNGHFTIYERS
jgi:hypothetical protein